MGCPSNLDKVLSCIKGSLVELFGGMGLESSKGLAVEPSLQGSFRCIKIHPIMLCLRSRLFGFDSSSSFLFVRRCFCFMVFF